MDFRQIDPELQRQFDIAGLYDWWHPRNNFFAGQNVRPGLILASDLVNPDLVAAFTADFRRRADEAQQRAVTSRETAMTDRVFLIMAQLGLLGEADFYFDRSIGRPSLGFNNVIGVTDLIQWFQKNYGSSTWASPEVMRGALSHWLQTESATVSEAFELWFGGQSVGWLTQDERVATLEAFGASISGEARTGLLGIWESLGGERTVFDRWWNRRVRGMLEVRLEVEAMPFRQEVRRGTRAYEELFSALQIGHSVGEIREWALAMYDQVTAEMDRLAKHLGYLGWKELWNSWPVDEGFPDGEALVQYYEKTAHSVLETLLSNRLLPPQPDDLAYSIQLTAPDRRVAIPIAACYRPPYAASEPGAKRTAILVVTPAEGDPSSRRQHALCRRIILAHELGGHAWGMGVAPHTVPLMYVSSDKTSLVGLEGVAFSMEVLYLSSKGVRPRPEEILAMLQGRAWRYARVIAETDWHITEMPFDQIVKDYAERSQLSPTMALRDMRRAAQEIWKFMAYAFGASGIYMMSPFYSGGFKEAVADIQASTGGFLPPNIYLWTKGLIDDPKGFNWLCSTDPGVEASRQLIS